MKTRLFVIATPHASYVYLKMDFGDKAAAVLQCWCDVPPIVYVPVL